MDKITAKDLQNMFAAAQHLTVARVVWALKYIFQVHDYDIVLGTNFTTSAELAELYPTAKADGLKITFWGGPPTETNWHEGTLLTFLVDSVLHALADGDAVKAQKFIDSVELDYAKLS